MANAVSYSLCNTQSNKHISFLYFPCYPIQYLRFLQSGYTSECDSLQLVIFWTKPFSLSKVIRTLHTYGSLSLTNSFYNTTVAKKNPLIPLKICIASQNVNTSLNQFPQKKAIDISLTLSLLNFPSPRESDGNKWNPLLSKRTCCVNKTDKSLTMYKHFVTRKGFNTKSSSHARNRISSTLA